MLDLVVIHPMASHGIAGGHAVYGDLGAELVAVEPPTWSRIIAGYIRERGFSVNIIDAEAEKLQPEETAARVAKMAPRLVCIAAYGHQPSSASQQMHGAGQTATEIKKIWPEATIIMVGGHVAALPEQTLLEEDVDYTCNGEGPVTIMGLLQGTTLEEIPGLVWSDWNLTKNNKAAPLCAADDLAGDAWDLLPMDRYLSHNWQRFGSLESRKPYASIYTSFGCPFKCLAGDTPVETVYGKIPIKELAEKYTEVGVFTYDRATATGKVSTATNIRQYGTSKLVRVHFDDGTHIDCTPDHQFLAFKWGNQNVEGTEWAEEAQNLKKGLHVRALKYSISGTVKNQYPCVNWSRRGRDKIHRLVASWKVGRALTPEEHVHHMDHNKFNFSPENLHVYANAAEHFADHPEIAQRMRDNNPTKNGISPEWRAKLTAAQTGLKRSDESKIRYRESKLGEKNPNYKHGKTVGRMSRLPAINHRVTFIEELAGEHPVYCLTVADTGWFYANNVLVKNCEFCCIQAPFSPDLYGNRYRTRSPEKVVAEIVMLYTKYGVKTFKIADEMYVLQKRHVLAICDGLIASGIADDISIWAYTRIDTVKEGMLPKLRAAGVRWLALGIEAAEEYVRDGAEKHFTNEDIMRVVRDIEAHDINVISNFIVGLSDDSHETMQHTLDMALELNTAFMNIYACQAYPGSKMYTDAVKEGRILPASNIGYSQHNKYSRPMDTKYVSGAEVLKFRDEFFLKYFTNPKYLAMVKEKFGEETLEHVKAMTTYKLERWLVNPPEGFDPASLGKVHA